MCALKSLFPYPLPSSTPEKRKERRLLQGNSWQLFYKMQQLNVIVRKQTPTSMWSDSTRPTPVGRSHVVRCGSLWTFPRSSESGVDMRAHYDKLVLRFSAKTDATSCPLQVGIPMGAQSALCCSCSPWKRQFAAHNLVFRKSPSCPESRSRPGGFHD